MIWVPRFGPLGKLDIPVPHAMRFSLPFMAAVTAAIGAPMSWRTLRRGCTKYLRLTPDGFDMVQGWRPRSGAWAQVENVTDVAPGQTGPVPATIVVLMSDGSTVSFAAGSCTPDGHVLRQLVEFYWRHSEHRGELTDGRALERLKDEQFDVDVK